MLPEVATAGNCSPAEGSTQDEKKPLNLSLFVALHSFAHWPDAGTSILLISGPSDEADLIGIRLVGLKNQQNSQEERQRAATFSLA